MKTYEYKLIGPISDMARIRQETDPRPGHIIAEEIMNEFGKKVWDLINIGGDIVGKKEILKVGRPKKE